MKLIPRVQAILLNPRATWPLIAQEAATTTSIYNPYVLVLAAIPAVAGFIGLTLVGVDTVGMRFRVPVLNGVVNMLLSYVLSLAMVWLMARLTDAVAPTFGGTPDKVQSLKLIAYASTAAWVGGIFSLLPALSVLGILAALYSVYLVYSGLPVLMKSPPDKSLAYTAVLVVGGLVAGLVLAAVSALFMPRMGGLVVGASDVQTESVWGAPVARVVHA